jgi:hypothetical protein
MASSSASEAQRQALAQWTDDAVGRGGVLEAVKGFRRVKGYADMLILVAALRARDRQLGPGVAQEERQIA